MFTSATGLQTRDVYQFKGEWKHFADLHVNPLHLPLPQPHLPTFHTHPIPLPAIFKANNFGGLLFAFLNTKLL